MKIIQLGLLSLLIACQTKNNNKETEAPTDLKYKIEDLSIVSTICKNDTANCGKVSFNYPIFNGKNSEKINELITNDLVSIFVDKTQDTSNINTINQVAKKFINEYEIAKKANQAEFQWTEEADIKVITNTKTLLTTHTNTGWYTGGAHPMSMEFYNNYDLETNKKISLDDIFKPNYDQALLKIGEEIFRADEKLKPTDKLDESMGYFFEKGKFLLNDNFLITKEGIEFTYNVYEIKAYVNGITTLKIPKEKISNIIKRDYFTLQ